MILICRLHASPSLKLMCTFSRTHNRWSRKWEYMQGLNNINTRRTCVVWASISKLKLSVLRIGIHPPIKCLRMLRVCYGPTTTTTTTISIIIFIDSHPLGLIQCQSSRKHRTPRILMEREIIDLSYLTEEERKHLIAIIGADEKLRSGRLGWV